MSKQIEALKLALEALEVATTPLAKDRQEVLRAITAIKEALAQTQEPVAWMFQHDETGRMNYVSNDGIHNPTMFLEMNPRYALVCPLYTTPPQRTEQEPVAWGVDWGKDGDIPCVSIIKRLPNDVIEVVAVEYAPYSYTHPPQRTWVDLTDEEVFGLFGKFTAMTGKSWLDLYRMTEAKLKEKNT